MSSKQILVATDFSDCAAVAIQYASVLARQRNASLLIVHVQPTEVLYGADEMYSGVYQSESQLFRDMLHRQRPPDPNIPLRHKYLVGDPATEIIRLAHEEGVELVVLGTHGRTGLSRMLMGSVAESVVRGASCPVLTVKTPARRSAT